MVCCLMVSMVVWVQKKPELGRLVVLEMMMMMTMVVWEQRRKKKKKERRKKKKELKQSTWFH